MNTSTEMAVGLGVVALAGTLLYFKTASGSDDSAKEKKEKDDKWKKDNPWDCSDQQAGSESPLGHIINQGGDWTGAQSCTSGSKVKKRTVTIFTGYGSSGPATCDPNDDDCDDDRERDCDVVHTMNIDLTEEDIAQKRSAHLLIESDADIQYLKDQCKAEQAQRKHQVEANRDEETRYTNLFTRLNNQFQADVNAGKNPNKLYTPELLKVQCTSAQLGAQYTQKILDAFASTLSAFNRRIISPLPTSNPFAGRDFDSMSKQIIQNWEQGIDKAKPNGPWPSPPTAQALIDGSGFPPALAKQTADTLLRMFQRYNVLMCVHITIN